MDIIDTHTHVNNEYNIESYRNKKIDEYLNMVTDTNINFFIPSINPKVAIFTCPSDCSNQCETLNKEYICPVNCQNRYRHRIRIYDGLKGNLIAYCHECKKIIYEGPDPFREYNLELIDICKSLNNALPNLVLTLSNSTINEEINFYEKNFPKLFLGYKVHQTTNMRNISSVIIDSKRPILVHTDVHSYDSYHNVISFTKKYEGNVILAHAYLITDEKIITGINNLYFDICPTDNFNNNKKNISHHPTYDKINNAYEAAISYLPEDKILFGTDWPYGDVKENILELEKANIDDNIKKKILSINAKKAYLIK